MNPSYQQSLDLRRTRLNYNQRRMSAAAVPAAFMSSPLKKPHHGVPSGLETGANVHTDTRLLKFDSDSSGICSDLSFHSASPLIKPQMTSSAVPSSSFVPRSLKISGREGAAVENYNLDGPLPTAAPPSPYADSNYSPYPKSPPRMYADSDESPEKPLLHRFASKPIGLKAFEMGSSTSLRSLSPKRIRYSSGCHDDDGDEDDGSLSPSDRDDISLQLSHGSRDGSSGFETDGAYSDFEAANIKWSYRDPVFTVADYAVDIYDTWRHTERTRALSPQFLSAQREISEELRKNVLLNVLSLRRNMDITHETIHLAVFLLDKCLDTFKVTALIFRDLAAVCLVIASKCEDYSPLKLNDVICMEITEREFSPEDDRAEKLKKISRLEKRVLSEVEYRLAFVTPFTFMNFFHQHLRSCLYTIQLSNYILELCLLSTRYRTFGGAFTAHAVVCLAKAIVCASNAQEALAVIEQTENRLAGPGRIPIGHTRSIMRLLLDDMQEASDDQNWIWLEYSNDDRCSVSSYSAPSGLSDVLSPPTAS